MKWIKHDTDANQDAKLQNVLLDYSLEGYGLYWYCIELIAGKVTKENITFELEHDARIIARNTGATAQKVEEMMRYFVDIGLFECSDNVITCLKLAKRLDKSMTSNPQMREIIEKLKSHDGVMTESENPMQDQIRLDQIREDKDKKSEKPKSKKQVSRSLDYSGWPAMPSDELFEEWKKLRRRLKANVSQVVINRTAKELHKAVEQGFTVDECFEMWIYKGWRGFQAEWMINSGQTFAQQRSPNYASNTHKPPKGWGNG